VKGPRLIWRSPFFFGYSEFTVEKGKSEPGDVHRTKAIYMIKTAGVGFLVCTICWSALLTALLGPQINSGQNSGHH